MTKPLLIFIGLIILVGAPAALIAQESTSQPEQTAAPQKEDLGMWWNRSSLTYSPLVKRFLVHTEITYSYTHYTGNLDGYCHDGEFMAALRKCRFTYYLTGELSASKYMVYVIQSTQKLEKNTFDNVIRYDLFKHFYLDFGHRWERETERLLVNRYDYYGGIGGYIDKRPIWNVSLFLGGGQEEIEYDKMVPQHVRTDDYQVGFVIQNATLNLGPVVTLRDRIVFRTHLEDFDNYDIALKAMISFWITQYASLSYRWEKDHYNKAFPIARKSDEQHVWGITLNLDL